MEELSEGLQEEDVRPPVRLFVAYTRRDEPMKNRLLTHLTMLEHRGLITKWHDRLILPGMDWDSEIHENLETSDLICPLISADFIASSYAYGVELTTALKMEEEQKARVVPILLRHCDTEGAPFMRLQMLPRDLKPVESWSTGDRAYNDIVQGLKTVVVDIRRNKK